MSLNLQFKLKSNPLYIKYLRENSYWYKILIRDENKFNLFLEKLKEDYKLRPQDKLEKVFETVDIVSNLLNSMV